MGTETGQPHSGRRERIAFYGGSFDPVHRGHIAIALALKTLFALDEFVFIPAFHAPHKKRLAPTAAIDRYAMLAIATNNEPEISVSAIEINAPEMPYSFQTLARLKELHRDKDIFFVIGADSWAEITTWREWETVLGMVHHIVVTRPGYPIGFSHVPDAVRDRMVDARGRPEAEIEVDKGAPAIYVTDAVGLDVSATEIRAKIREGDETWRHDVPEQVAKYLEKYQIYK